MEQITITGTAQHAAWQERTQPPVERLDGGLWSVPVPIPDSPLRYTLCYLLPGDDGLVVVDPGWDTPEAWTALVDGLAAAGATPADVTGIVATHVHADHHGLTARLRDASGAWVAMHPAERDSLPQRAVAEEGGHRWAASGWLRSSGAPEDAIAEIVEGFPSGMSRPMAEPDLLLDDGDLVPLTGRTVRVVWTPGHTPGHICLHLPDADLVLTGDHVLPRITPNIGLQPLTSNPPLADFLTSLERIGALDGGTTDVLPAHEYRFRGLALRTRALQQHHERRCQELLDVVADLTGTTLDGPTLWQITERLTWSRPWAEVGPMRIGALAETGAHVQYLTDRGDLRTPIRSNA